VRSGGDQPLKGGGGIVELHYEPFREGISRVVGSNEGCVLQPFQKQKGAMGGVVLRKRGRRSVGFVLRKKKAGWGRLGRSGG
jgi:hypothetical protein